MTESITSNQSLHSFHNIERLPPSYTNQEYPVYVISAVTFVSAHVYVAFVESVYPLANAVPGFVQEEIANPLLTTKLHPVPYWLAVHIDVSSVVPVKLSSIEIGT